MKRSNKEEFRCVLEPLCIVAIIAYAFNRWIFSPDLLTGWFDDFLLIPAAMPPFLWLERQLGLRKHDCPPDAAEIAFLVVVWSIACEGIAPLFIARATADWKDVAAYSAGGFLAWLVWRQRAKPLTPREQGSHLAKDHEASQ